MSNCNMFFFLRNEHDCPIHTVTFPPFLSSGNTVKFLNFQTPENFAVIYLKFKQRGKS